MFRLRSILAITVFAAVAAMLIVSRGTASPTNDGRIVYSIGTTTPQSRPYSASSNLFGATATLPTTVNQSWFVIKACPVRDEMIAAYASGTALYVARWDGTAWTAGFNVTTSTAVTGRWFDVAYEASSGDAIVVYATGRTANQELNYRTWNGTAWSAATAITSNRTGGAVNWVKLASHPTTDAVALAFSDNAQDLSGWIWDGTSAWGNEPGAAFETSLSRGTTAGDYDAFDLDWEASGQLMLVWASENASLNDACFVTFTSTWSAAAEVANLGVVPAHVSVAADRTSDNVALVFSRDAGSTQLYGTLWNGTSWNAPTQLNTVSGARAPVASAINRRPFDVAWITAGSQKVAVVPYATSAATNSIDYFWRDAAGSAWNFGTWTVTGTAPASEQWLSVAADPSGSDTALVTFSDLNSDLFAKRVVMSTGPTFAWTNADGGSAITTSLGSINEENFAFAYKRAMPTLTVGDGASLGDTSRCPEGTAAAVDAFTLQTSVGSDAISAVTVALSPGSWEGIGAVQITNDAESTTYGTATPSGDTVSITLTTNITATATLTQYRVRLVPRAHAAMPARPGASYTAGALVTALTSAYTKVYNDTTSATLAIDNASPAEATWGSSSAADGAITLNWTNPPSDFAEAVIIRNTVSPITDAPAEGASYTAPGTLGSSAIVYVGNAATFTDNSVTNGTTYYYRIFARDACGNYSSGAQSAGLTPNNVNPVVRALPAAGSVDSCTQISLSAPFQGDSPTANNTVTFDRATAIGGPWTTICSNVSGGNPRVCVSSGLTAGATYYYRVTFSDPDGVEGQNPQHVGPFTTPATCLAAATTTAAPAAQVSSCRQITVSAPFSGDGDADGTASVEYNTTNSWPGTTACSAVTGGSPRACLVSGLGPSTAYYLRITFADPDGVSGTNPRILGPITTGACGSDAVAPMVMFLAPARDAVVGGTDKVRVQVWDLGGIAANGVAWSIDGGTSSTAVTTNANLTCGTGCTVYEFTLDTTAMANGPHYITVQATDSSGNIGRTSQPVFVNNSSGSPRGSGTMLRRTHGSQLCGDCHALSTHSSQSTSTKYGNWAMECLSCHTPHRTTNIELIRNEVATPSSGRKAVTFRTIDKTTLTNPQNSFLGAFDATGAPFNDGVCEVCHTRTTHYRNDSSGGDHTHQAASACIKCHKHTSGFRGEGGGDCRGCHGLLNQGSRRTVDADFARQSHHVGNGGSMGGALTNFDCVVCHGEGAVVAGETASTNDHGNGIIDLRDADSTTVVFAYDKGAVASSAGAAANWNSTNAVWRQQTSTKLDPFCLSCHDANGASAITSFGETGATASNPFNDTVVTNNYDLMNRGGVVDIKSKVSGAPPSQGTFARHAIRGQAASIYTKYQALGGSYTSIYEFGGFTNMGTDELNRPVWNDTSVMGCADCHTTDGANGDVGNAHGSTSEYLLKDAAGGAAEGNLVGKSYNCFRCHAVGKYDINLTHAPNGNDYQDTTALTGTARTNTGKGGSAFGMACTNCHGGAGGFGWIHGTNQTFGVGENGGAGTRNAHRFMNGGSLRYYQPSNATWSAGPGSCYTLSSPDSWGACTQHNRSAGSGLTAPTRPLTY